MKKGRYSGGFLVLNVSPHEYKFIKSLAEQAGIKSQQPTSYAPHLFFYGDHIRNWVSDYFSDGEEIISMGQLCEKIINHIAPKKPVMFGNITPEYTAEIKEEGIQVGCQLITYGKFDELVEAVNKFRKDEK